MKIIATQAAIDFMTTYPVCTDDRELMTQVRYWLGDEVLLRGTTVEIDGYFVDAGKVLAAVAEWHTDAEFALQITAVCQEIRNIERRRSAPVERITVEAGGYDIRPGKTVRVSGRRTVGGGFVNATNEPPSPYPS